MIVTVKYFGLLTDVTQTTEEQFSLVASGISVNQLKNEIAQKYPLIDQSNFTIAVNQSVVNDDVILNNNDVMALLPPFAGG
jgi:molybdopterin synthase sulfur carrier subunit